MYNCHWGPIKLLAKLLAWKHKQKISFLLSPENVCNTLYQTWGDDGIACSVLPAGLDSYPVVGVDPYRGAQHHRLGAEVIGHLHMAFHNGEGDVIWSLHSLATPQNQPMSSLSPDAQFKFIHQQGFLTRSKRDRKCYYKSIAVSEMPCKPQAMHEALTYLLLTTVMELWWYSQKPTEGLKTNEQTEQLWVSVKLGKLGHADGGRAYVWHFFAFKL